jgi:ABC-2 type transport system permease protein
MSAAALPAAAPSRTTANPLGALIRTESRLFLRDPVSLLVAVLLPTVLLVGLGAIPALREPAEVFGGTTFVAAFAPSLLAISIAQLGLQTLPQTLAAYRERGVLRRYSTTPVSPLAVLVVQLVVNVVTALLSALLLLLVAVAGFGVPAPAHPLSFVLAVLLGTAGVFSIGLLIAAVAPRAKTAAGLGAVAFLLSLFFAGVYLPYFLLPDLIVRIGEYLPPAIGAIKASWTGAGASPLVLLVQAVIVVGASWLAARLFRWE